LNPIPKRATDFKSAVSTDLTMKISRVGRLLAFVCKFLCKFHYFPTDWTSRLVEMRELLFSYSPTSMPSGFDPVE